MILNIVPIFSYAFSAYVGQPVSLSPPSVPGTMGAAAWYCDSAYSNKIYVNGNSSGASVVINEYFSGTATIYCQYAYSYISGSKVQHGNGTAEYSISCLTSRITLSHSSVRLKVGEEMELSLSNSSGYDLPYAYWKTSNKNIVSINDGEKGTGTTIRIKAEQTGEAEITCNGFTGDGVKSCSVSVMEIPATSIRIEPETLTIGEGKTGRFKYILYPSDATSNVKWASSDNSVATVSSVGVVTAKKGGYATITATTAEGLSASGRVNVVPLPSSVILDTPGEIISGYSYRLAPRFVPENSSSTLKWMSSNVGVVSVDEGGNIQAVSEGSADISVITENDKKATSTIKVCKGSLSIQPLKVIPKIKVIKELIKKSIKAIE